MHTISLLLAIGLSIGASTLHAFEIKGRVVDLLNQGGLGNVEISFLTLDGKIIERTQTDGQGNFHRDMSSAVKQFRIAYAKSDGGPDGLGYEGYGRGSPVENNVNVKDVDTVALRPRRKGAASVPEKEAITKDWLSYYFVTKDAVGLKNAIKFYGIQEPEFKRSARLLEGETGRPPIEMMTYGNLLEKG